MISVCVPYWKRPDALKGMIMHYDGLYGDMDLEIVVCDDGTPEPWDAKLPDRRYSDIPVAIHRLPTKDKALNPCVPINRAVEKSHGDVIVLTNPEIRHQGPVLLGMLELLQEPEDYVTARCWDVDRKMWLADESVDFSKAGRLPVPPGGQFHFLAAFSRELWDKAGGFDEDYRRGTACDDNDWLWRLHRAGARFRLAQGVVHHFKTKTPWAMPHNRNLFYHKWPEARALSR